MSWFPLILFDPQFRGFNEASRKRVGLCLFTPSSHAPFFSDLSPVRSIGFVRICSFSRSFFFQAAIFPLFPRSSANLFWRLTQTRWPQVHTIRIFYAGGLETRCHPHPPFFSPFFNTLSPIERCRSPLVLFCPSEFNVSFFAKFVSFALVDFSRDF